MIYSDLIFIISEITKLDKIFKICYIEIYNKKVSFVPVILFLARKGRIIGTKSMFVKKKKVRFTMQNNKIDMEKVRQIKADFETLEEMTAEIGHDDISGNIMGHPFYPLQRALSRSLRKLGLKALQLCFMDGRSRINISQVVFISRDYGLTFYYDIENAEGIKISVRDTMKCGKFVLRLKKGGIVDNYGSTRKILPRFLERDCKIESNREDVQMPIPN